MQFSGRILKVKPSATLAITALANSLKAKGVDVIGFGSGEPDFDTPAHIKNAAIRAIDAGKTKYTPAGGIPELKKAIVEKFRRDNGLEYDVSQVTVNCGGKHSFYNLMQVLLNDGDEVIVPAPYWVSYPPIVELAGGVPVILNTGEESGFKITPSLLEKAIGKKTRAVILNSPSNPTGATYSRQELEGLAAVLEKHDIAIISDDIYESIVYDGRSFTNTAGLSNGLYKNTIILNGVSKAYSMTGWRIGYMAGDAEVIKKVEILQSQSTSNPTSISQWASVDALTGDQSVIAAMVEAFDRRRRLIVDGLNSAPGITCLMPEGAFYAFPNIRGVEGLRAWKDVRKKYEGTSLSSALTSYLLEVAQVAVVPGVEFGSDDNIRLSFATSDENIGKGVERIKAALEKLG
ncbi:MAG TPA: pyridoxal phosphate-dependent aminotransferase [Spirochaetota bacterium]|nr:pyridoxal phosphate-dependent aminotransferase [Spirochaetota bacterium]OPZ35523.1 MAG: Aspartate aminotransferase [Spirochaetes bacterium ADurb.BinA120]HNU93056.1 pyridoxal phosphate-dependent aminotransferase [Spirochaetota bacterium]HPI15510.1 pyridoxal phosphate-dependent aminotransferase [Spirochaetota bacterium]HPO46475.1 pyridoxal phosphate-dependent aminotransferase [Spirochaetota bacterium]